jgi:hypothetical protein
LPHKAVTLSFLIFIKVLILPLTLGEHKPILLVLIEVGAGTIKF